MKRRKAFALHVVYFVLLNVVNIWASGVGEGVAEAQDALKRTERLFFIENKGQWHEDVLYLCRMGGLDAWITKYGVNYTFYRIERKKGSDEKRSGKHLGKFDREDWENRVLFGA